MHDLDLDYVTVWLCDYVCPSQTPITIHILKAYDESYSKITRGHKYKDNDIDNDNEKHKDTDKVPENPKYNAICFKSWRITHSKYDDWYLTLVILFTPVTLVTLLRS